MRRQRHFAVGTGELTGLGDLPLTFLEKSEARALVRKKNREGGRVVQPSCIDEGGGVGGEESND